MVLTLINNSWEQRKLASLIVKGGSGGTPSTSNPNYYLGTIPFLSITDITNSDGYIYDTEKHITEEALNNSAAWIVPSESISLAMYASVGKVAILKQNTATSQAFYNLVINEIGLRNYLFQYLKKMESLDEWTLLVSTGTQSNLNAEKVKELIINIPTKKEEQSKVGNLLLSLDQVITLHQRKFEKLTQIKKSLLEKMFPADGANKPKIRFKGFTEVWEQRKLGELGEIMTGYTPSTLKSEYYSEDGIPWVTPTDINAQTISDTPRKLSEDGMKVGRVVPANTILCTCIASVGKNTLLTVKGSFNQQINSLTPYVENDAYFLLTESELWSDKMKRMAASGTMQIVNKTEFSELTTMVPKTEEQKKIGEYFSNLDNLITLHQRKCEKLKNIKKSLLEKMFV